MAIAGKKDPLKKQKDTLNFRNNAVQRYASDKPKLMRATLSQNTPRTEAQKQGQKTLDSIKFEREMHKIDKDYELKRCNTVGICSSAGTHRRRRESRIMDKQETRAKDLVKGYKVGPNPYK